MIFRVGPLPEAPEFTPDDSWILVREPTVGGFQLRAIPIALVTTVVLAVLWIIFTPIWHEIGPQTFPLPISKFIACLLGVIVVHELIHASVHPKMGISENTVIGFWSSRMFIYTIYVGELTGTGA
jgi:predicted ABC-type exoprotein transport system permease subunit